MSTNKQYTIIREDLFPSYEVLEKLFETYKEQGLDVKKETQKLIDLGYIK